MLVKTIVFMPVPKIRPVLIPKLTSSKNLEVLKNKIKSRGIWLAQLLEHAILDPEVLSSSPMLGMEPTLTINQIKSN